jgi:hypothetical protein
VIDLDCLLDWGAHVGLEEIDVVEFRTLKLLRTERARMERERVQNP